MNGNRGHKNTPVPFKKDGCTQYTVIKVVGRQWVFSFRSPRNIGDILPKVSE